MKKIIISAAVAAMAFSTSAMAADKGIDITTTGQAVLYYETHMSGAKDAPDMFNKNASAANVGLQLNLGANLGNGFTFGSQLSYLGTAGLEKNLVGGTKQDAGQSLNDDLTTQLMLSKIYVAKTIGNSTVKLGRQELPKSLSPLAFSEGWNVFKNTFDAALLVNTDIPKTTLVGAYVSKGNSSAGSYSNMDNLGAKTPLGSARATGGAYMVTAQTTAIPMTTLTGSYYHLSQLALNDTDGWHATDPDRIGGADAFWVDAKLKSKDLPLGLCAGVQVGSIMTDLDSGVNDAIKGAGLSEDTMAFGVKVGMAPIKALNLSVAFSSVDDGAVAIKNTGTGIKTPLYTQMVYNQNAIASSADTIVVKGSYGLGGAGKIIAAYGLTAGNNDSDAEYNELDVIYKVKAAGVQYFAALMYITADKGAGIIGGGYGAADKGESMDDTKVRVWARYAF